jgi:hypothetical protein
MGSLVPNAKLIYERVGEKVYARREGETERTIVGYAYERDPLDHRNYKSTPKESQLWHDIRLAGETNHAIADLLEKVKTIYLLSKEYKVKHGDSET